MTKKKEAAAAPEKKKKKEPKKRGARSVYQDNAVKAAQFMAACGMTDEQIARELGIATSTLYEWKKKYPELSEALKKGKFIADGAIIESLYKRATGYEYDEITYNKTIITVEAEDGSKETKEAEEMEIKRTRKVIPPDTTAIIYWLNNRRPDLWRNVNHIKHSGSIGGENEEIQQLLEQKPEARDALKQLYRLREGLGDTSKP